MLALNYYLLLIVIYDNAEPHTSTLFKILKTFRHAPCLGNFLIYLQEIIVSWKQNLKVLYNNKYLQIS